MSVWGLPLAALTRREAVDAVMDLVDRGEPSYFITANTHYAMVSDRDDRLREINRRAAFILADGAPIVWASRLRKTSLPERVAGSDLIFRPLRARGPARPPRLPPGRGRRRGP